MRQHTGKRRYFTGKRLVLLECEAIGQSFYTGVTFLAQVGAVLV